MLYTLHTIDPKKEGHPSPPTFWWGMYDVKLIIMRTHGANSRGELPFLLKRGRLVLSTCRYLKFGNIPYSRRRDKLNTKPSPSLDPKGKSCEGQHLGQLIKWAYHQKIG